MTVAAEEDTRSSHGPEKYASKVQFFLIIGVNSFEAAHSINLVLNGTIVGKVSPDKQYFLPSVCTLI